MKKIFILFLFLSSCSLSEETLEGTFVHDVIDGDTMDVEEGRIRLSGINTPETGECYYQEAKDKLTELVLYKEVYLEEDMTLEDKYGRLLRYVYTNTTFINGFLVEHGYARVYDKYNETTKYYLTLKELESKAQEQHLGIWNCTSLSQDCLYVASKNSDIYHTPECKWAKRIAPENLICFHSVEELEGYTAGKDC